MLEKNRKDGAIGTLGRFAISALIPMVLTAVLPIIKDKIYKWIKGLSVEELKKLAFNQNIRVDAICSLDDIFTLGNKENV